MELTKIKMAGFKSFVDPITVSFPSQWNCIVGPNGCGKSNTIDAIRCVMGESAAKQLRGGAMEDMIFNGCATRKPVSQASIELFFDNSDGGLGGPYAAYSEIALKRTVSRDGQSNYYLNGTRCRRRDIQDVFLGTGLGPRSYSIIEQGTISRVVEAKPLELRNYLEEAAGVSKYKERRRETENRIKHTRENLERVLDLREELDKQQAHLKRQADAAERYQTLKAESRLINGQVIVLNWKNLESDRAEKELLIQQQQTALEKAQASSQHLDTHLTELEVDLPEKQEDFNQKQAKVYECVAEIKQYEQSIEHHQKNLAKRNEELQQIEESLTENQSHLGDDQSKLADLVSRKAEIQPGLESSRELHEQASAALRDAEVTNKEAQDRWEQCQSQFSRSERQVGISEQRIEHLNSQIMQCQQRIEEIEADKAQVNAEAETVDISDLMANSEAKTQQLEQKQETLTEAKAQIIDAKEAIRHYKQQLDQKIQQKQELQGDLASLKALQKTALGKHQNQLNDWLNQYDLANKPRLAELLDVEPTWALAVETVLSHELDAICIDELADVLNHIDQWPQQSVTIYASQQTTTASEQRQGLISLASKVQSGQPHPALMSVFIAEDLASAKQQLALLQAHESLITADGLWLNQQWLKIIKKEDSEGGVLQREQQIKEKQQRLEELLSELESTEIALGNQETQLSSWQEQSESLQQECNDINQALADIKAELRAQQKLIDDFERRQQRLMQTLTEQQNLLEQRQQDRETEQETLTNAQALFAQANAQKDSLQAAREAAQSKCIDCRQEAMMVRERLHEYELQWKTIETELGNIDQAQSRLVGQIERLQSQKASLMAEEAEQPDALESMQAALEDALSNKINAEEAYNQAKIILDEHEHRRRELEQERSQIRSDAESTREKYQQSKLEMQTLLVKQANLKEQFEQTDFDFDEVLQSIPEGTTLAALSQKVETLDRNINRLGAINLAAIEEYKTVSERKQYLDEQNDDLEKALATLDAAIKKIDQETRSKLRETFELINGKFQELFPKVFGGGQASLVLTEQDWLTTGISITARPPGKRNASIHMLSGGEKALTAVAFVFAIFHLNPAPFCMLDEVDAPLDDANVERFCRLVEEMSKTVKFIIISHNKLTISKASNLIGVTMKEAGVSRTVSVDVEEAVSLSE